MQVHAVRGADVDPLDRGPGQVEQGLGHLTLQGGHGEHRTVVVRIVVQVQEAGGAEVALNRLQHGVVAALADVGHGQQKRIFSHAEEG